GLQTLAEKSGGVDEKREEAAALLDVREHQGGGRNLREGWDVRNVTTIVPLIRRKVARQQVRTPEAAPISVATWRPFQVTVSERRPVQQSARTLFNLVPCNRTLETAFVELCNRTADVAAFAKNAGPQCLRIDYLSDGVRLAFYTPDFLVRSAAGSCYLVETKGQVDKDVPTKARAAGGICLTGSRRSTSSGTHGSPIRSNLWTIPMRQKWRWRNGLTACTVYGGPINRRQQPVSPPSKNGSTCGVPVADCDFHVLPIRSA
ncbi:MAG: hypothetical protein HY360_16685, partial [Verrucomicrobia bacterium]|nr:hypothetical protein [Verrucomicrobiota bacterium]